MGPKFEDIIKFRIDHDPNQECRFTVTLIPMPIQINGFGKNDHSIRDR